MGMGMMFTWLAYEPRPRKTLDLMVQACLQGDDNDVLISIPLFVFMGYLVERANPDRPSCSARCTCAGRVPASLAVADAVHLRGVRHGHRHRRRGGHADGPAGAAADAARRLRHQRSPPGRSPPAAALGILIPPSVMLIVRTAAPPAVGGELYAAPLPLASSRPAVHRSRHILGWAQPAAAAVGRAAPLPLPPPQMTVPRSAPWPPG